MKTGPLLAFFLAAAVANAADERGLRIVRVHAVAEHGAGSQSWQLAQDQRGVLYVANLAGVVEYDGHWWRVIPTANGSAVRSLAVDVAGRVAVGGYDELGLLKPDATGTLRYQSLVPLLRPGERAFAEVGAIHALEKGFAFVTSRNVLFHDGASLHEIATLPAGERRRSFEVSGTVYLWSQDGLARLTRSGLTPVAGRPLAGRPVELMLAADAGRVLVAVEGEGLFLWTDGAETPFAAAASEWLRKAGLVHGCRLADGRYAFTTRRGGALLVTPEGEIDEVIDGSAGLPDAELGAAFSDRDGSLWLVFEGGLARIEASSRLSIFDSRSGFRGMPNSIARLRGALHVATGAGLFAVEPGTGGAAGRRARARTVGGLADAWSLASAGDELLVGTSLGVHRLTEGSVARIEGTAALTAYVLLPSPYDEGRVWAGFHEGLGSFRRDERGWRFEGLLQGAPRQVHSLVERPRGVLWAGTILDGAVRIHLRLDPESAPLAERVEHFGRREVSVNLVGEEILLAGGEILRFDEASGRAVPHPLSRFANDSRPFILRQGASSSIWMNTQPPGVASQVAGGGYRFDDRLLVDMPGRDVQMLEVEPDGVVWLGTERGLARYDTRLPQPAAPMRAPLVRRLTVGRSSVVFGGAAVASAASRIRASSGRLRFECAPASYGQGTLYQYRLDPAEPDWSEWTPEATREYTNLREGSYRFLVRTKGLSESVSPEAAYTLEVLAPWFRTGWALGLYAVALALGAAGVLRVRHRSLERRNEVLRARVAERTLELGRAVEELRRAKQEVDEKNALLEGANTQLEQLSQRDGLTGIANRRRLDAVLADEWSRARRLGTWLAAVLIDIDKFKGLNDTLGHQEGDACLKRVASLLEASLRRTGDVAARYGGEEFLLILPVTDEAGAVLLAERIRAAVEALAIPHPAVPLGRVTVSLGAVARRPQEGGTPDELVNAADRVLYQAKAEGRNRVCSESGAGASDQAVLSA